jgi:hypothetical protein
VRTTKDGQFLESSDVLAGHDHQTIELGPTDYDDVLIDVLGNVSVQSSRAVGGYRLRNCA